MSNKKGFSHIIIIVVVFIVLSSALMAGWKIYSTENNSNTKEPIEQNSQSSNELQNSNDVKALEEDIKSTDLDAELNTSELEAGITELQ